MQNPAPEKMFVTRLVLLGLFIYTLRKLRYTLRKLRGTWFVYGEIETCFGGVVFLLYMGFDIKYLTHWVDVSFSGLAWIENFQLI